jgi:hypothetical protein
VFGSSVGARDVDLRREVRLLHMSYSRWLLTVAYRSRRSSGFVDYFGSMKEDKSSTLSNEIGSLRRMAYMESDQFDMISKAVLFRRLHVTPEL